MSKEKIEHGVPSHKTVHDGSHGPGCTDCVAAMGAKNTHAEAAYTRAFPNEANARALVGKALRGK